MRAGSVVKRSQEMAEWLDDYSPLSIDPLTVSNAYIIFSSMYATIYGRGQMVIPARARKKARIDQGDLVLVEPDGDGRIILTRMEKPNRVRAKIRIQYRKGTHAVATAGQRITSEQIRSLLSDFP